MMSVDRHLGHILEFFMVSSPPWCCRSEHTSASHANDVWNDSIPLLNQRFARYSPWRPCQCDRHCHRQFKAGNDEAVGDSATRGMVPFCPLARRRMIGD